MTHAGRDQKTKQYNVLPLTDNDLRGIRMFNDPGDGTGAGGDPVAPVEPVAPVITGPVTPVQPAATPAPAAAPTQAVEQPTDADTSEVWEGNYDEAKAKTKWEAIKERHDKAAKSRDEFKGQVDTLTQENTELKQKVKDLESKDTKLAILTEAGLLPEDLEDMRGENEEEWKAWATKLATRLGVKPGTPAAPKQPTGPNKPTGGVSGVETSDQAILDAQKKRNISGI